MKRGVRVVLGAVGLVAGCTCGQPGGVDPGADVMTPEDAPATDTPTDAAPDVGRDAWAPDAWIPDRLTLREVDPRPCDPITPQPRRPRGLPADPTPRVLWARSYEEIGLLGPLTFYAGSVDRAGNLTFETQGIHKSVGEIDASGALRGEGMAFRVVDDFGGPTMSLVDGRSAQFYRTNIRVDSDPPNVEATETLFFPSLARTVDFQELAATSDGGFYAQRASHGALRKYCGDGRLQWELLGVERAEGMMVEADDSVWLPGASRSTNYQAFRIDVTGHEVERLEYPEGARQTEMGLDIVGDVVVINFLSPDGRRLIAVGRRGETELWRIIVASVERGGLTVGPLGGVWAQHGDGRPWQYYVDGVVVNEAAIGPNPHWPFGADGSFFSFRHVVGGDERELIRIASTGEVLWTLPIEQAFQYMTLDVDGRLYLYGAQHVIAVQTDVLPPGIRGCWQHRCSPQGDNRIEPLP